ncbi:MAG TPA: NAD(P)/FAD-dependent oxidoreductase [Trebonia sp.]|jgi:pyruvate/2-oxoglutarate dehydrogenase complex dihydrolipoamide dehydrogenase (E3) component
MSEALSVLVAGGGPAGIAAALQASELGARVTLVEAGRIGGTSLNRGPAPVRTLARAARLARDWTSWSSFGLHGPAPVPDLPAVLANSERVARYAHDKKDMAGHLRRHGVCLFEDLGTVRFTGPHTMTAGDGRSWTADRVIVAVGGHAARPPVPGAALGLTYEDIPSLTSLPARVAVIGGADTGCQIASIFDDFGATVTVFEAGPVLVPATDHSVSAELARAFSARGMAVATGTLVEALEPAADGVTVRYRNAAGPGQLTADAVFFAVGWPANDAQLALEDAGIATVPGVITVDEYLRTSVGHIFAAGDVNGRSMVVQTARTEGRVAAKNAVLGAAIQVSYDVVASGSFTDPEYGRVGLTEEQAAREYDIVTGTARYDDLLRPVADGRPEGFCKLIADRDRHTIVGAHVVGEYSAETVQTVAAAMAAGMTVEQLAELQFAYPTFTEGVSMAAQMICRSLGLGHFPRVWGFLGPEE